MDKPKPNKLAQFYSGQIQPNGALSLRRSVQFWSGVDTLIALPLLRPSLVKSYLDKMSYW
jgi:hypothetical protein